VARLLIATVVIATVVIAAAGCGGGAPTAADPAKRITWAEYQKLDAEQKDDPYVTENLDDDAKKRLADAQRKRRK
jgi:predicted small lipoprotein YifL